MLFGKISLLLEYCSKLLQTMEISKIRPLEDNIVIEPLEREQRSASGIVIPDTSKEKPQEGKVIAVGPGKMTDEGKLVSPTVKVGDRVLYKKWGGNEIKLSGKEYLVVKSDDIMAVIEA